MGVKLDGYYGDSAVTVPVGDVADKTEELLRVTKEALERAIAQVEGRWHGLSDIGHAVQEWVEAHGFSVVREFVGHGIGEKLHEEPQIPNYGQPGRGPKLAEGMVLAIEPMVAMGRPDVKVLGDGWTAVTNDGSLAAHFEHTVAVTADGPLVLTARADCAGATIACDRRHGQSADRGDSARARCIGSCSIRATSHRARGGGRVRNFVRLVVGDRVASSSQPKTQAGDGYVKKLLGA